MYQKHVNYGKKPSAIYVSSVSQLLPIYQTCVAKRGPLLRKVVFFYSANINIFFLNIKLCIHFVYKNCTRCIQPMHCVKSVQIRSYFWSVFFCIRTEYRKIRTRNNSAFHAVMCTKCIQNVYHISTNFCVHFVYKIKRIMADKSCIQNLYKSLLKCGIHFVYKHFV